MDKNYLKILGVLFLFLIVIFFIWKNGVIERPFNQVETYPDITIYNRTNKSFYDTILNVGLKQMNLKPVVTIMTLSNETKANFDGQLKAHIRYDDGSYVLFIDDLSRIDAIDVISHEIIHIDQYESRKIIYENGVLIWDGQEIDFQNIPYNERPWEVEAFEKQNDLSKTIKSILY